MMARKRCAVAVAMVELGGLNAAMVRTAVIVAGSLSIWGAAMFAEALAITDQTPTPEPICEPFKAGVLSEQVQHAAIGPGSRSEQ